MGKKRSTIPKQTEKRVYQEANSCCAFCSETEVSTLQIHHIDGNPSNNICDNLILVCANCHSRITLGALSEADVVTKKRELFWTFRSSIRKEFSSKTVNVGNSVVHGTVANEVTNIRITTPKAPRISHPLGSIGANLQMKGYIDYLVKRYFEYKKADSSFGKAGAFNHAEIHKTIEREFGAKTFFLPEAKFEALSVFLKGRIERTILGKRNKAKGTSNFHSFEEHVSKHFK